MPFKGIWAIEMSGLKNYIKICMHLILKDFNFLIPKLNCQLYVQKNKAKQNIGLVTWEKYKQYNTESLSSWCLGPLEFCFLCFFCVCRLVVLFSEKQTHTCGKAFK